MDTIENFNQQNTGRFAISVNPILGPQYFLRESGYQVESLIGWGSLGPLMLAHKINTKDQVAIKRFYFEKDDDFRCFFQLFYGLSLLQSPYSINLIALLVDIVDSYVYLVMEYFPNGNLGDYIKENKQLSSAQVSVTFISILKGLIFLKENNISHGNLKLSNILIGPNGSPILTDFGLTGLCSASRILYENQNRQFKLPFLTKQNSLQQLPCFLSDFGAAGAILWALCGNSDVSEISAIQNGNIPDISERNHHNFLQLACDMIVQDSIKDHAPPETILSKLQKQSEPQIKNIIKEDQRKPQPLQMYLKLNQMQSLKLIKQYSQLELEKYHNLSYLSLDLSSSLVGNPETKSLLSPLRHFLNLSSLELDLSGNMIGADEAQHLLLPLADSINLVTFSLNLNRNSIGDIGAQSLLLPIKNLVNLELLQLNLYNNSIGVIGASSLFCPLSNLNNLQSLTLYIQNNTIKDAGAQSLLLPIANLVNLSNLSLILDSNEVGDVGAQYLLLPLEKLLNLSILHLDLSNNNIESTGAQYLLNPIANLINVTKLSLDLNHNQIGPIGAASYLLLPLSKLTNLSFLSLSLIDCSIGDNGAQFLLLSLTDLTNLSSLFIQLINNKMTDTGFSFLFHPLTNLKNISNLSISAFDNFLDKEIEHIFKLMFKKALLSIQIEEPIFF